MLGPSGSGKDHLAPEAHGPHESAVHGFRQINTALQTLHVLLMFFVADFHRADQHAGKVVPRDAGDFYLMLLNQGLGRRQFVIIEISNFFVPKKLQLGMFQIGFRHHF